MEPWPPAVLYVWRLAIIPFCASFAVWGVTTACGIDVGVGFFVLAVLVASYFAYRLDGYTKRIEALETQLAALTRTTEKE
jgi:hypothetical protein